MCISLPDFGGVGFGLCCISVWHWSLLGLLLFLVFCVVFSESLVKFVLSFCSFFELSNRTRAYRIFVESSFELKILGSVEPELRIFWPSRTRACHYLTRLDSFIALHYSQWLYKQLNIWKQRKNEKSNSKIKNLLYLAIM